MNIRRLSVILISSFFFVLVIAFTLIVFLFFFFPLSDSSSNSTRSQNFQVTEITWSKNGKDESLSLNSKFSFAELPLHKKERIGQEENEDDFISYSDSDTGSFFVLTPFGGSQYECTGKCTCESSLEERRTASVFSRALNVIIVALTVPIATRIADAAFSDQCIQLAKQTGSCDVDFVGHEIEACEKVEMHYGDRFSCKGHCIQSPEHFDVILGEGDSNEHLRDAVNSLYDTAAKSFGDCEARTIEKDIDPIALSEIFSDEEKTQKYRSNPDDLNYQYSREVRTLGIKVEMMTIKELFIHDQLVPFCQEFTGIQSTAEIQRDDRTGGFGKGMGRKSKRRKGQLRNVEKLAEKHESYVSYCSSGVGLEEVRKKGFPNVQCVAMVDWSKEKGYPEL